MNDPWHSTLEFNPDWATSCSWLSPESPAQDLVQDTARAVRQLARLFPPAFCRGVLRRSARAPDELRLLIPLILPGWIQVSSAPLLFLGDDLGACSGWQEHKSLIKRLRCPREHLQARFEVALWAGMLRERVVATRVAEGAAKSADFEVIEARLRVAVEAKVLSRSKYDLNFDALLDAISHKGRGPGVYTTPEPARPMPHELRFHPSSQLIERLDDTGPAQFEEVYAEPLRAFFSEWYAKRSPLLVFGKRDAPNGLGEFEILPITSPRGNAETRCSVHAPEPRLEEGFRRALSRVRDARGQLQGHDVDLRVAVVWTSRWTAPIEAVPYVLGRLLAEHPKEYESLDWIVFLNFRWRESWEHRPETVAHRVNPSAPDIREMSWYKGIRHWRLAW